MTNKLRIGEQSDNFTAWCIREYHMTPLCFTAADPRQNATVGLVTSSGVASWCHFKYSTDLMMTWNDYDGHNVNLDECEQFRMYIKADPENPNSNGLSRNNGSEYHKFIMTGEVIASGDVTTLIDSEGNVGVIPDYGFYRLFYKCNGLVSTPVLPSNKILKYACAEMFSKCTSLMEFPSMRFQTVGNNALKSMFQGCTSLIKAGDIKITNNVGSATCQGMFQDCTSLSSSPLFTINELGTYFYNSTFEGCTSLITPPVLNLTVLKNYCYQNMFKGCSSLSSAPDLIATTLGEMCYSNMFLSCDGITECHMKSEMSGIYDSSIHGDTTKIVRYDI